MVDRLARDYPRLAPATRRTYAYAAEQIVADIGDLVLARIDRPTARRLARQWPTNTARVARTMFGELRHACATLLMERGLPPHVVANELGHTDGGALVQRLYGHPSERSMRDQVRLAFSGWGADGEQPRGKPRGNSGVSHPS